MPDLYFSDPALALTIDEFCKRYLPTEQEMIEACNQADQEIYEMYTRLKNA